VRIEERELEAGSRQVRRNWLLPTPRPAGVLLGSLVLPARLLSQRCPTVQVPEGLLVQLACERHDLDPCDLLASAHSRVEEVSHCRGVVTVRERPCRLIARGDSSVEYHDGDAGHLFRTLGGHPHLGIPRTRATEESPRTDPELSSYLRIEERELEAGGLN
jgi:hypothetical protein